MLQLQLSEVFIRRLPHAIFLTVLCVAFGLRIYGLGDPNYNIDEINHIYAAKGLVEQGRPVLPSGLEYNRGLFTTQTVALSFDWFGYSEWAARVPFVFLGIVFLALVYVAGTYFVSPWFGLAWCSLLAFSPEFIHMSRFARLYGFFNIFYFLAAMLLFWGYTANTTKRAIIGLGFGGVLMLLAAKQQIIGLALPLVCYLLAIGLWFDEIYTEKRFVTRSRHFLVVSIGIVLAILATLVLPDTLSSTYEKTQTNLLWSQSRANNIFFYWYKLGDLYSLWLVMLPILLLVISLKLRAFGVYLCLLFLVPFILHSFVFSLKAERYLYHAYPFFYALFAFFVFAIIPPAFRWLKNQLNDLGLGFYSCAFTFLIVIAVAFYVISRDQWLRVGLQVPHIKEGLVLDRVFANWKAAGDHINAHSRDSDIIVATSSTAGLYYVGRVDYVIDMGNTDIMQLFANDYPETLKMSGGHIKEYYGGRPYLRDVTELAALVSSIESGWFVSDTLRYKPFDDDVFAFIESNMTIVDVGTPTMLVARW